MAVRRRDRRLLDSPRPRGSLTPNSRHHPRRHHPHCLCGHLPLRLVRRLARPERENLSTDQETLSQGTLHLFRSFSYGTPRTTCKLISCAGGGMDAERRNYRNRVANVAAIAATGVSLALAVILRCVEPEDAN